MKKSIDIINEAREQLKSLIVIEVKNIHRKVQSIYGMLNGDAYNEDGDYTVDVNGVTINVEVDTFYLNVEERIFEKQPVVEIHVSNNDDVFVVTDSNEEINWKTLSTDELADIVEVLEKEFWDI